MLNPNPPAGRYLRHFAVFVFTVSLLASAQTAYQPKFKGDPAHSNAEAIALGYMRTLTVAQQLYKTKHGHYAESLAALVGHGSFTRRMTHADRGDYMVEFHSNGKDYSLSLVPKQFDAAHRAFYVDETGHIRADTDKPATASSERLEAK
jgi:hypothetical protein